jgi:hypothetical protein
MHEWGEKNVIGDENDEVRNIVLSVVDYLLILE